MAEQTIAEIQAEALAIAQAGRLVDEAQDEKDRSGDDEEDFSQEPVLTDAGEPIRYDVPGLPIWFCVKRHVPYQIATGRNMFASQQQQYVPNGKGGRKPSDTIKVTYDFFGLFLYKCENCIVEWEIRDPRSGKVERSNNNPAHTKRVFSQLKSEKVCEWISSKIDQTLGWDKEGQELEEKFPGEAG